MDKSSGYSMFSEQKCIAVHTRTKSIFHQSICLDFTAGLSVDSSVVRFARWRP